MIIGMIYYIMYTNIYICIYMQWCIYVSIHIMQHPDHTNIILHAFLWKKTRHTLMRQKNFIPLQSIHASSFGLQLSKCQKATGALNSRNTSATVKLKPRGPGFSYGSNRPLKSVGVDFVNLGGFVSSFNRSWKYVYIPHKKGPFFLKREMKHPNPAADIFFERRYVRFQGG